MSIASKQAATVERYRKKGMPLVQINTRILSPYILLWFLAVSQRDQTFLDPRSTTLTFKFRHGSLSTIVNLSVTFIDTDSAVDSAEKCTSLTVWPRSRLHAFMQLAAPRKPRVDKSSSVSPTALRWQPSDQEVKPRDMGPSRAACSLKSARKNQWRSNVNLAI